MPVRFCVAIPLYDHCHTVREVTQKALRHTRDVMVIDDGSTDCGLHALSSLPVIKISLGRNMGKGFAIKRAAAEAKKLGYTHIITVDADGQHNPDDIPAFLEAIRKHPRAIIIGARDFNLPNVPGSSKFGRKFSGFWAFIQTGYTISDMQSGFRAYPIEVFNTLKLWENRYSFEIEIIIKAIWAGFEIREIPIVAYYPPKNERISHFRAFMDNLRISLLNARLTVRALTPLSFNRKALDVEGKLGLSHPLRTFSILSKGSSPHELAKSASWSLLISSIPIIGFNTLLLLGAISRMKLNRLCALVMVPLTWFPVIPALCVLAGHRIINGRWLTEFNMRTLGNEAPQRLLEWFAGSMVVAPFVAITAYGAVYFLASIIRKRG